MKDKFQFERIGEFMLNQPIMRVSDPCYNKDVWCSRTLPNCRIGTWEAFSAPIDSEVWGYRIAALAVRHIDGPSVKEFENPDLLPFGNHPKNGVMLFDGEAGVDSGQCGFFDETFYQDDGVCKDIEPVSDYGSHWYNLCCDITLSKELCGVLPCGAVSSSGAGDGGYPISYIERNGQVVAAMLMFMDPND